MSIIMMKKKHTYLKFVIPILIFVFCLIPYIAKISIALGSNEHKEERIETVVVPNKKTSVEINLIGKLSDMESNVMVTFDEIREYKSTY